MTVKKYLADSKMFEYDKYYRDCQQQNRPFIKAKINPVHSNYFVQVDLMTCNNNKLVQKEQKEIAKLIKNEMTYVKHKAKYEFQGFSIDKELAWFDGVSAEHVNGFCSSLYDLICKTRN